MTSGIYAIVNKLDGRAYVGSSIDIEARWAFHQTAVQRGGGYNPAMISSWGEDGKETFDFLVLEEVIPDDELLEEAEQRWFNQYEGRLYNFHKTARRRRPTIEALLYMLDWGALSPYKARQLARRRLESERETTGVATS